MSGNKRGKRKATESENTYDLRIRSTQTKIVPNITSTPKKSSGSKGTRRTSTELKFDQDDGHLIIVPKTCLNERYIIIEIIGQGTFGKVVEAYDKTTKQFVAVKIIKAIQKYTDAAKLEIEILKQLRKRDPNNTSQCIHLQDSFVYNGHHCMVFELLKQSLFDYFEENEFQPFSLRQIQSFT
jgi:dual-specificity kinase